MSEIFTIGSINMIKNNTGKFHKVDFTMTEKFKYVIQNWYDKAWSGCEVPYSRKYDYLTGDMTLFELGMDSLDEVELILNLELVYNISITDDEAIENDFMNMKLEDMCEWVENKAKLNNKIKILDPDIK